MPLRLRRQPGPDLDRGCVAFAVRVMDGSLPWQDAPLRVSSVPSSCHSATRHLRNILSLAHCLQIGPWQAGDAGMWGKYPIATGRSWLVHNFSTNLFEYGDAPVRETICGIAESAHSVAGRRCRHLLRHPLPLARGVVPPGSPHRGKGSGWLSVRRTPHFEASPADRTRFRTRGWVRDFHPVPTDLFGAGTPHGWRLRSLTATRLKSTRGRFLVRQASPIPSHVSSTPLLDPSGCRFPVPPVDAPCASAGSPHGPDRE